MISPDVATIGEMFRKRIAISAADECYRIKRDGNWHSTTWAEFGTEVDALAAGMVALGIGRGDAIAILGDTAPQWCQIDLATILVGGMNVGIYQSLLADQIQFILDDASVRMLFVQGQEHFDRLRPLLDTLPHLVRIVVWDHTPPPEDTVEGLETFAARGRALLAEQPDRLAGAEANVEPSDAALVVYTSGTTGRSKGVPLSHQNVLAGLTAGRDMVEEITPDDITMSFLPMAHVAEHVPGFLGRINIGLTTAYATNYDTVLDELQEVRPTYFGAVPRIFEKMYGRILERVADANPRRQSIFRWAQSLARAKAQAQQAGITLPLWSRMQLVLADKLIYKRLRAVFGGRVKAFVTGAAPIQTEILEFFTGAGLRIIEVYGLSEATAISFANTLDDVRLGTVGKPIPCIEYKLEDDGEILLRGPTVFGGYLNLPEENAQIFDAEGFLRTGDIGKVDGDGYLRITDRKKNLIKTAGGKYVVPARLEALIKDEPLVSQVYVHGDMRPYVVGLVTLDERETGRVAELLGVTEEALPSHPDVLGRIAAAVERANARLARFERIKKHAVLPADFSIEAGTLTPTMKLKRRAIAEQFSERIDALYAAP